MNRFFQTSGLILGTLILLMQFQNCDIYSDNSLFTAFNSLCEGEDCVEQDSDFLEVRINSDGDIPVYPLSGTVDIGGDCNEGGFEYNFIRWSLFDDQGFVQDSDQFSLTEDEERLFGNQCTDGQQSCCVNGKWQATVFLNEPDLRENPDDPAAPPPPVDRTGLKNASGNRVPYRVEVEIFGLRSAQSSQAIPGPLGRRQIFLIPASIAPPSTETPPPTE